MKIVNFKRQTRPRYSHETTLHFLHQYYFWAQLGHVSVKDMFQFWLTLWLNRKVYTCSRVIKPQIGETVEIIQIEPKDIFDRSKQVIDNFYYRYGKLPEYLLIGREEYIQLNSHVAFNYELRAGNTISGVKLLLLPDIEGIVALPDLEKLQWNTAL